MRVNEITKYISEASIFDPKYPSGTLVKFSGKTTGNALLARVASKLADFDKSEQLEKLAANLISTPEELEEYLGTDNAIYSPQIIDSKGKLKNNIYAMQFKRENGDEFYIVDTGSNLSGNLTRVFREGEKLSTRSKGLVAEALLGVAMYAKLIARGGDLISPISSQDVWNIVDKIKPSGEDRLEDTVNDRSHKVSDKIHLAITLATDVQHLLTDKQHRGSFRNEVDNWVNYANSALAQKYADVLYKNDRPDNVTIMLAGKEGGKLDVGINVLDAEGHATSKFKQVKLSVKLSDGLIGQVGRGGDPVEAYNNLVQLFSPLGVDLSPSKDAIIAAAIESGVKKQFIGGMNVAYEEAYRQLKALTGTPEGDAELALRLARLADHHATGNDPHIQVIEAGDTGNFRLLNYKGLHQSLAQQGRNIDVDLRWGSSSKIPGEKTPALRFYDVNNSGPKGRLIEIRIRGRGGYGKEYANNIIEPLSLMKDLAAFKRFRKSEPQVQPQQLPQEPQVQQVQPEPTTAQTPDELEQIKRNAGLQPT